MTEHMDRFSTGSGDETERADGEMSDLAVD